MLQSSFVTYCYVVDTRSSADADKTYTTRLEVSQGHQTWYHSIC